MINKFLKQLFPLYYVLILFYLLMYLGTYNSNYNLVILAINLLTIWLGNYRFIFAQLFFLLPFSMIYKTAPGTTSLFTYGMLMTGVIAFLRSSEKSSRIYLGALIFFICLVLNISSNYSSFYRIACGILCLIAFVRHVKITDIKDIVLASALGIIGASYMGLSKMSNPNIARFFSDFNGEWINGARFYRFSALMPDPNYYSISVIITLFLILVLLHAKVLNRWIGLGMIAAMVYYGSRSYSRIFTISVVAFGLYFLYYYMKTTKYKFIGYLIGGLILYFGLRQLQATTFYENMSSRFQEEDVTNGRTYLTRAYLQVIFEEPSIMLYGKGLDGKLVNWTGAHNTYVETLYFIGLLGCSIFLALLYRIFRLRGKLSQGWQKYVLFGVFLICIGSLGYFSHSDLYFYLMLVWANMYFGTQELTETYTSEPENKTSNEAYSSYFRR